MPIRYRADVSPKLSSGRGAMDLGITDLDSYLDAATYAVDLTDSLSKDTGMSFYVQMGGTVNLTKILSTPWTNQDHIRQFANTPVLGVHAIDFTGNGYEIKLDEQATNSSITELLKDVKTEDLGNKTLRFSTDFATATIHLAADNPLRSNEVDLQINGLRDMASDIRNLGGIRKIETLAYWPQKNSVNLSIRCDNAKRSDPIFQEHITEVISGHVAKNGWEPIESHGCE